MPVAKTLTYPVMYPFPLFVTQCDHNPPTLQMDGQTTCLKQKRNKLCYMAACRAKNNDWLDFHNMAGLDRTAICSSSKTRTEKSCSQKSQADTNSICHISKKQSASRHNHHQQQQHIFEARPPGISFKSSETLPTEKKLYKFIFNVAFRLTSTSEL